MTQEERQLLFQDLAARVPYGLKGQCEFVTENDYEFWSESNRFNLDVNLEKISKDGKIRVKSFFRLECQHAWEKANEEMAENKRLKAEKQTSKKADLTMNETLFKSKKMEDK